MNNLNDNGRRPLDAYYTERRVTDSLLLRVRDISGVVCEPCAGDGMMAATLAQHTGVRMVVTNDIDPCQPSQFHGDAGDPCAPVWKCKANWVITNPPFSEAHRILPVAFSHALVGVAFLLRLSYLEPAKNRAEWFNRYGDCMTNLIVFGQPRPSFTGNGQTDSVTTAWMVWRKDFSWARLGVIRPFDFAWRWQ